MANSYEQAGLLDFWAKTDLKGTPSGPLGQDLLPEFPALGEHLRGLFAGNSAPYSTVALLDWTTIRHVHALMTADAGELDMFVAVADLNTLLAAALFYDRAVVIDDAQYAAEVAELLGITDVLIPLASSSGPKTSWGSPVLSEAFNSSFQVSASGLANQRPDSTMTVELNTAWKELLPDVQLPSSRSVDEVNWSPSPGHPALFRQLFRPGIMWSRDDTDLVIENDVRAMTYENVAALLTGALATDALIGPNVRYLGGVLRSPMQRAIRARWRETWDRRGGLLLETALNERWAHHISDSHISPAFPFWLSAVLNGCETRADLAKEIPKWRKRTKQLRQRRAEIERLIMDGNLTAAQPYEQAITGAVESLTEAKVVAAAASVATTVAKSGLAVTGIAPFVTDAAGALLDSEVSKLLQPRTTWLIRVTRPRLWFLAKANASASQLTQPTYRLKELFELPDAPHGALGFLARANSLDWSV
jgi:hypothetical protein